MNRGDVRRAMRNVALVIGLAGVLALAMVALFGPQLTHTDPQAQRIVLFYPDGDFKIPPSPPDALYPLGTDPLGRDQLARLLYGARLTFTVVLLALLLRTLLALVLGIAAGWRHGPLDDAITLVTNAVAGLPQLLLALLLAILLRDKAILGFVVALGLVGWAEGAQFVRAETRRIRAAPYIEAATAIGDRTPGILSRHVFRGLAPQLFGLVSLEAGATLLLLAELGFLGVFMSGAIFLVDDQNRPILPVRDRAPEWGQMLAGAQQYAFSNQYVAFVPGVVVAAAVFAFNLLGEGARAATDPFSAVALSPRAIGSLARGLAVFALVSAAFFGVAEARTTQLSFDDAMRLAREASDRVQPGNELIAGVVRLASDAHALARPAKYNFYFRQPNERAILRVGFPDIDQNAMEVKRFDDDDGLLYDLMIPPEAARISWNEALAMAESQGGAQYRSGARTWLVRVVLSAREGVPFPYWRAIYSAGSTTATPAVDVTVDARSGEADTPELHLIGGQLRAEGLLNGPVVLTGQSSTWVSSTTTAFPRGFDAARPSAGGYDFVRSDLPNDQRVAFVGFRATSGPRATADAQNQVSGTVGSAPVRPAPLLTTFDLERAFAAAEAAGGKEFRGGVADWSATASAQMQSGTLVITVNFTDLVGGRATSARFAYDPITDTATRVN